MSENSDTGILSMEEAVERMMTPQAGENADDETVEAQDTDATGEADTAEEPEAEAEATEDAEDDGDPEVEWEGKTFKLSELTKGYLRQQDYTRKTQEAAEQRKAAEREAAEAAQLKQQLSEALKTWAIPTEQEPNWAELVTKLTPQEYNQRRLRWEDVQKKRDAARAEFIALQTAERQRIVQEETQRLMEAVPEWKDPEKFHEGTQKIVKGAATYGFSAEEIAQVTDHRMIRVLRDAQAWQELQRAKASVEKKTAEVKPMLKPGAKPNRAQAEEVARQKARERLKKTGSIEDAVALILRR